MEATERAVAAIALLDEPTRRRLYEYVVGRQEPTSRDQAAAALGIGRELAAFHLDKLAGAGLLQTENRRLTGRTGPGAGRPAKVYRRGEDEVLVSLPRRDYRRAATLFAEMLDAHAAIHGIEDMASVARERGRAVGCDVRARAGRDADAAQLEGAARERLDSMGYEPRVDESGSISLCNCPYAAVAESHTNVMCATNLAWFEGFLDGLAVPGLAAVSVPGEGRCCVDLRPEV